MHNRNIWSKLALKSQYLTCMLYTYMVYYSLRLGKDPNQSPKGKGDFMKKAKNVKVGDVVQFPAFQFSQIRTGWNGWIFRAGIVEKLYTGARTGTKYATVRYCTRIADRYTMLPNVEETKNVKLDNLFMYNLEFRRKIYLEALEAEKNGEHVCWDNDDALLVNHNIF